MVIKQETAQVIANFQYNQNLNSGSFSLHNIYSRKLRIEKKFCLNLKVYSS